MARSALSLSAAVTVHAGALLVLGAVRVPPPSAPGAGTTEIDLDLSAPEPSTPEAAPSPAAAKDPLARSDHAARLGRAGAKVDPGGAFSDKSALEPQEPSPASPEPSPSAWSFNPLSAAPGLDLRAAVTPDLVAPAPASPERASPRTASSTGGLAEGLAERDVELGLGHGGAVLALAEAAVRSEAAPEGSATFDVTVRPDGSVLAQVLRSEGGAAPDWARVADAIARSVDPRRMRLSPGQGWHVVVRVEARVKLPDGREVRSLHGPRLGVTRSVLQDAIEGKAGGGSRPGAAGAAGGGDSEHEPPPQGGALGTAHGPQPGAAGAALEGLAARVVPMPNVSVSGKVCSATLALTPGGIALSGGCSPENIGAHGARVVTGRVESEGAR